VEANTGGVNWVTQGSLADHRTIVLAVRCCTEFVFIFDPSRQTLAEQMGRRREMLKDAGM